MFAICLEASHSKGMGHLYRMLNFYEYLNIKEVNSIFLINNDIRTKNILDERQIKFEVVNLNDIESNWEKSIILKYNISYWINDRLDTLYEHAVNVKKNGVKLITFDDLGNGAELSDFNICGLFFDRKKIDGKHVLKGSEYLILNNEINEFKCVKSELKSILVSLGGSDTYGVTIKVLKMLKKFNIKATIHIGPSFSHQKDLLNEINDNYPILNYVPSLIREISKHDLIISGGGITPFEANALGVPALIIANEIFEIPSGQYLDSLGSSKFLGYHDNINELYFEKINQLDLKNMSQIGLSKLSTQAIKNIYKEIISA